MENKCVFFFDLDGTLIRPASGNTFPTFAGDLEFILPVLDSLKAVIKDCERAMYIYIISNQAGIQFGHITAKIVEARLSFVANVLESYLISDGMPVYVGWDYAPRMNDPKYKPKTGMIDCRIPQLLQYGMVKENMIMIGDASGLPGDHSDSDLRCAKAAGIDYMDVREFMKIGSCVE